MSLSADLEHAISGCRTSLQAAVDAIAARDDAALVASIGAVSAAGPTQHIATQLASSESAREELEESAIAKIPRSEVKKRLIVALTVGFAGGLLLTTALFLAKLVGILLVLYAAKKALSLADDTLPWIWETVETNFRELF